MRGGLNGLQALILQECPYAYYVHCLAHQLQLVLVASAKEVAEVHTFFQTLNKIVNVVCASCKRNDELQTAYEQEIIHLVENDEIATGRGANQTGTLQRPVDTRWSSHFTSICSLLRMYNATILVLEDYAVKGTSAAQRGDAKYSFKAVMSFEFVFILHVMKELMGITDKLCQALQKKSQDILNAMCLVSSTKALIQKLRDFGWDSLLQKVKDFCNIRLISIPDMSASFADLIRSRRQEDSVTVEHHYCVDLFNSIIETRLHSKMGDDFLKSYMIVYIEDEIAEKFTSDMIIDEFDIVKPRRLNHTK